MFELFDPEADVRITAGSNLPHWYQPGVTYFVTMRTNDSIPADVARRWHFARCRWLEQHGMQTPDSNNDSAPELNHISQEKRREYHQTFSRSFMENLDKGWGDCVLRQSKLSQMVADALLHFDGQRYDMGDFVVMPNHVHLLVRLLGDTDIVKQCASWKRFTANRINQTLDRTGRFWQADSFDHLVRSSGQLDAIKRYIHANPRHLNEHDYFLYSP